MRVQPFYLTGKLNSSRLFFTEDEFEGVRRLPFGLIDGVDVAVDGFKSGGLCFLFWCRYSETALPKCSGGRGT